MNSYKIRTADYFAAETEIISLLDTDGITRAMDAIVDARNNAKTIYLYGNGGSAATASHIANDFNKGINERIGGKRFRMVCLSDNIATITAIANDISFSEIFRFQLREYMQKSDVVLVISGSGNSVNLLNAASYAKENGGIVIGMTGGTGGKLLPLCDYSMHVPDANQQYIEDIHMIFDHMMMRVFCDTLEKKAD